MILFYLLIVVMPLSDHDFWTGQFAGLTPIKYLGALCGIYAVFHCAVHHQIPPIWKSLQARLFLLFYALVVAWSFLSPSQSKELNPLLSYSSFLVQFLITLALIDTRKHLKRALLFMVGSTAFASLYVIRQWFLFHNQLLGFRPGGVSGDSNYFALCALPVLLLALSLLLGRQRLFERVFYLGSLGLVVIAFALASSRGAFLGLVAGCLPIAWHTRRRFRTAILAAVVLAAIIFAPGSALDRLLHPTYGDQVGTDARTTVWKAALKMIKAHPLQGIGIGEFKLRVVDYEDEETQVKTLAHSTYLEIATEMGIPSLLIYVAILYSSYRTFREVSQRALRAGMIALHRASLGLQGGLLGCAVALFFITGHYQRIIWFVVFLSMCLPRFLPKDDYSDASFCTDVAAEEQETAYAGRP